MIRNFHKVPVPESGARCPRSDSDSGLDYFSTQVSRRSTYWTGISL